MHNILFQFYTKPLDEDSFVRSVAFARFVATSVFFLLVLTVACTRQKSVPEEKTITPSTGAITGKAPRAFGGFPSVITFEPYLPQQFSVPNEVALLDQYNVAFHPKVLIVQIGQKVNIKNSEDTLHNVHVIDIFTRETAFNVATPAYGFYEHTFDKTGVYDVSCGIHPAMAAFIVVSPTPYVALANSKGNFSINNLPTGKYNVTIWNVDPSRRSDHIIEVQQTTRELLFENLS